MQRKLEANGLAPVGDETFEAFDDWMQQLISRKVDDVGREFLKLTLATGSKIECRVLKQDEFIALFKEVTANTTIRQRVEDFGIEILQHEEQFFVQYKDELISIADKKSVGRFLDTQLGDAYKVQKNLDESLELLKKDVNISFETTQLGSNKVKIEVDLPHFRFRKLVYYKRPRTEWKALRREFECASNRIKKAFIDQILEDPEKVSHLKSLGFDEDMLGHMRKHHEAPEGWDVHHKIPLDDGGTNKLSNFVMIPSFPKHEALSAYQKKLGRIEEGKSIIVDWPDYDDFVYPF